MTTQANETTTEMILRQIEVFVGVFPEWTPDTPANRLRLAQHLGWNLDMVQMARDARPKAILPDVREVIAAYEEKVASLRAREQNIADLLENEVDRIAAALEEMRIILGEMRDR